MAVNVYEYYKGLPAWGKAAVVIGTGVIAYAVGKSIWNAVEQVKKNAANLKTAGDAVSTLNQLAAQGELPSYPDTQFQAWASSLVQAMSGCTTDHATLENIFNALNNDADVYKLIAIFGSQNVTGCTVIFIPFTSGGTFSLPAAVSTYVSADEKTKLNAILASKGITYVFA